MPRKKVKKIIPATDPDREGEAIAWHVKKSFRRQNYLQAKN